MVTAADALENDEYCRFKAISAVDDENGELDEYWEFRLLFALFEQMLLRKTLLVDIVLDGNKL